MPEGESLAPVALLGTSTADLQRSGFGEPDGNISATPQSIPGPVPAHEPSLNPPSGVSVEVADQKTRQELNKLDRVVQQVREGQSPADSDLTPGYVT